MKKVNNKMNVGRHKLDGCKFLSSFYGSNIFGKFFNRIQSASNLPKKCPIPGNELFEIRNYTILDTEYPPVLPALSHQLLLQIETDDKIIADIVIAGAVTY
ncbi:uncharacterized protein LOC117787756 [Drosophila innubila]|uniref:uncharacterized protein LOC117787756 n=1 Tax=Drosophila innubila TaxID=198719 RepID=UPI00148B5F47|nr:uncharacterized protein LOC117787756 [Drosophila innubila]